MDWFAGNSVTRRMQRTADRIDLTLMRAAERYLEHEQEIRRTRARQSDAHYQRIQDLRKQDSQGLVLVAFNEGLGWDEWEYQLDVERAVKRETAVVRIAIWATRRPFSAAFGDFIARRQRAQTGWDFRATFSLDSHFAQTLGPQLLELADQMTGRDAQWLEEMRAAGEALVRYANKEEEIWKPRPASTPRDPLEAEIIDGAKTAIQWVAVNLIRLRLQR